MNKKKRARKSNCSRQFRVPVLIMIWSLYVCRIEMLVIMQLVWVMKMSRVKKMVNVYSFAADEKNIFTFSINQLHRPCNLSH